MNRNLVSLRTHVYACILALAAMPAFSLATIGIEGVVLDDATSLPLQGAYVFYSLAPTTSMTPYVTTGPAGGFRIELAAPGLYTLQARRGEAYVARNVQVTVEAGQFAHVTIRLQPAPPLQYGSIRGIVTNAITHGPIAGARIHYRFGGTTVSVTSLIDGSYLIGRIRTGNNIISVRAEGFAPRSATVAVTSGSTSVWNFALQPTPNPASITGVVKDAATSQPLAGVRINYTPANVAGAVTQYVMTDAAGAYRINNLGQGSYRLVVSREGYRTQELTVSLALGQTKVVNVGLVPIQYGTLAGTVKNALTEEPIVGARVYYRPSNTTAGTHTMIQTDALGRYSARVAVGQYQVTVEMAGFIAGKGLVTIAANETNGINFLLTPAFGSLAGRVVDANTSAPLANVRVYYGTLYTTTTIPCWYESSATPTQPCVLTDPNGNFRIERLPAPKLYYLLARREGYSPQERKVTVYPGRTENVIFRLSPIVAGSIAGLVTNASTTATVGTILPGAPIPGAKVYYTPITTDPSQIDPRMESPISSTIVPTGPYVVTGTNGRYTIPNLKPGTWQLIVQASRFTTVGRIVIVVANQTTTANFALKPKPAGTGTIFGKVLNAATSAPLAGVLIYVVPDGSNIIQNTAPSVVYGHALTNSTGNYVISNIPPGYAIVLASKDGFRRADRRVTVYGGRELRVDFRLQPVVPVSTGGIAGTVKSASDQTPIAGAVVRIAPVNTTSFDAMRPPDLPREVLTDENGEYGFRNVPVGSYKVAAAKAGFVQQSKSAVVQTSLTTEVNFLLAAAPAVDYGQLTGRVVDAATSAPLVEAWICVQVQLTDALAAAPIRIIEYTNAAGYFMIDRVPVGTCTVFAAKRGYMPANKSVTIVKDQLTQVSFGLQKIVNPGVIEGNVKDASSGTPLAGIHVVVPLIDQLHVANAQTALHAITNTSGYYRIEGVPAGLRKAVAYGLEYIPLTESTTVTTGRVSQLDFLLVKRPAESMQTVTINAISTRTGEPLFGVRVGVPIVDVIEPFSPWDIFQATTGVGGTASLPSVPRGTFFVVGSAPAHQPGFTLLPSKYESAGGGVTLMMSPFANHNAAMMWERYD